MPDGHTDSIAPKKQPPKERQNEKRPNLIQSLGPGLITGASDDDPSGIATYSQVGAQYGNGLAWSLIVSYPLMAAIQEIAARIGRVTGRGIGGNLTKYYPWWLARSIVGLLMIANVINLGADLGAMGAAVKLLIHGPALLYVIGFGLLSAGMEIFMGYQRYVKVLKYLCLSLLSYVACAFVVKVQWGDVAKNIVMPPIQIDADYIMAIVAVLGTTISPYLFFWQANQEVEDTRQRSDRQPLVRAPEQAAREFSRIRIDTYSGMFVSNLIAFFIVITTAATLHATGKTDVETSAQAAEALRQVAGPFTFVIFATGIIGTGLLTVPVLTGSAAFAVGEIFHWRVGLAQRPTRAKAFYVTIAAAMAAGVIMNVLPIEPMKALYWSAVINGIVAVPVMVIMMRLAVRKDVMAGFKLPRYLWTVGWIATAAMGATVLALFWSWVS
ncbi:MAG TPA: divalent metal cation transporter [Magnetospirillaceae bacterium]|jgi:NRAMP (natural resistance-associated macrophage protein)-like metal ion transporter